MSGGASTQLELLYVKKNYEALYKDVQKKDSRNDLLARELKEARAKRDETQRELRLLEAVFEKVNHDKIHLEMELKKVKDMGRNIPPNGGGGNKSHETRKLEYDLRLKERRIDQLEKEVSHLKTSNSLREASFSQLAAHNNASSSSIADGNTNNAPEVVISSLCEELGKQKTDAHGLALTLAGMHHDLMQLQSDCLQVSEVNANVNTKVLSLEEENKRLTRLTAKQMSEIASLHKQNSEEVKINGKLGLQIEELSARLHSERNASLAEILALKQTCDAQKVELEDAHAEKELLREKISALNASHANLMVMFRMTEELISVERQHSKEHQWDLEESTKAKRKLEEALAALQGNLAQAVERNKELERCLKEQADKQREWEKERDDHRSRVSELLDEIDLLKAQREEALEALRNSIASIKDISRKLSVEREGRVALEGEIEALKDEMERTIRSKSQVTTAVLEALAKEKSRSHTLEQTLQDVLPTSPRTPSGTGRQELRDYNATTSLKQPLYRRDYPSPTSQDEYEALETHRKAFLSVSPLQGLPSASAQIQALCSELRKIEEKVPSPLSRTQSMGDSDEESLQTGGSEGAEQFDFIPEHDECEHSEQRVFTRGEDQEVVFISSAEARKQSAELGRRTVTELNSRRPTFPKKELSLFDIAEYDIDTDGTNS